MKTYLNRLRIPFSITLLVSGLLWVWVSRVPENPNQSQSIKAAQIGFFAPEFELSSLNSEDILLSSFQGKPVILNYWASWCPPCKAEMPAFQQAYQEFAGTDLIIIAINAANQDSLSDVVQFVQKHELTFPIALDKTGSAARDYQVHSLPTTYFIDKNGVIQDIIIGGPIPLSLLRIQAKQLLAE